jgi:hypothetical protein
MTLFKQVPDYAGFDLTDHQRFRMTKNKLTGVFDRLRREASADPRQDYGFLYKYPVNS